MKLVRDGIPELIEESGKTCKFRTAHGLDEHIVFLRAKMAEETSEFFADPCYEEAADMVEVIKSLCYLHKLEWEVVLGVAVDKEERRGGFLGGIILESVNEKK